METTLCNGARGNPVMPKFYLLWRRGAGEALFLAKLAAEHRPAVLVRLVNQHVDAEAVAAAGVPLVTLPMAFAGLNEHDQVLRDAVLQRLLQEDAAAA